MKYIIQGDNYILVRKQILFWKVYNSHAYKLKFYTSTINKMDSVRAGDVNGLLFEEIYLSLQPITGMMRFLGLFPLFGKSTYH